MRVEYLRALEGGITRLRNKGGALASWLYDLVNGYVRIDGSIASRPGTTDELILPAGTKGYAVANGLHVVFSASPKTCPAGVSCEVLRHPTDPTQEIAEIHFAGPFLGNASGSLLYVVAEFDNGDVFHYYQRTAGAPWESGKNYKTGDIVTPTTPNGLMYVGRRLGTVGTKWAPQVSRALGDKVEPTVANGYVYEAVDMGGNPTTGGKNEPVWVAADGAEVIEYTMDIEDPSTTISDDTIAEQMPSDIEERYENKYRDGLA